MTDNNTPSIIYTTQNEINTGGMEKSPNDVLAEDVIMPSLPAPKSTLNLSALSFFESLLFIFHFASFLIIIFFLFDSFPAVSINKAIQNEFAGYDYPFQYVTSANGFFNWFSELIQYAYQVAVSKKKSFL